MAERRSFCVIVDSMNDFVSLINKDYVYEIVNKSYCDYRGVEKARSSEKK